MIYGSAPNVITLGRLAGPNPYDTLYRKYDLSYKHVVLHCVHFIRSTAKYRSKQVVLLSIIQYT